MPKKCPPGVICIENMTLLFIFLFIFIIVYFYYSNNFDNKKKNLVNVYPDKTNKSLFDHFHYTNNNNSFGSTLINNRDDVLLNPYTPPLKNDFYNMPNILDPRGTPKVPINISTSALNTNYSQVGILTRMNGGEIILPLMGRPLYTNRDKWQYYTLSERNIKLPVVNKGKSCTSTYGCDNLYNGDSVYVEGYNDAFNVTIYDNNTMEYIPII
tara:strand:+ start:148 stop:783 length:636 start_codon:yes stop_codon:yes gene_type:complete